MLGPEITKPISEIYSLGFANMLGSVLVLVNGLIFARFFQLDQEYWTPLGFIFIITTYSFSFISFILIKNPQEKDKNETWKMLKEDNKQN